MDYSDFYLPTDDFAVPPPPSSSSTHQRPPVNLAGLTASQRAALKKAQRRGSSYVPRPPNAFILFRADYCRRVKDGELAPKTPAEIHPSAVIGDAWHALTADEKAYWDEQARLAALEHKSQHPDYKFCPVHKKGRARAPDAPPTKAALSAARRRAARKQQQGQQHSESSVPPPPTPLDSFECFPARRESYAHDDSALLGHPALTFARTHRRSSSVPPLGAFSSAPLLAPQPGPLIRIPTLLPDAPTMFDAGFRFPSTHVPSQPTMAFANPFEPTQGLHAHALSPAPTYVAPHEDAYMAATPTESAYDLTPAPEDHQFAGFAGVGVDQSMFGGVGVGVCAPQWQPMAQDPYLAPHQQQQGVLQQIPLSPSSTLASALHSPAQYHQHPHPHHQ